MEVKFYVYEILDHAGVPFYIGRTKNIKQRMYEHWREATKKNKNNYTYNKIRKLIKDHSYELKWNVLFDNLNFEDSVNKEIEIIKNYKLAGFTLTNLTEGGEGLFGVKRTFTEEWKQKLRDAKKNYVPSNKSKKLEEIIGIEAANEQKKRIGDKISQGIKDGKISHNKGKSIEEIVSKERADELRKISSDTAKKTFTNSKQTEEHVALRISSSKKTREKRKATELAADL